MNALFAESNFYDASDVLSHRIGGFVTTHDGHELVAQTLLLPGDSLGQDAEIYLICRDQDGEFWWIEFGADGTELAESAAANEEHMITKCVDLSEPVDYDFIGDEVALKTWLAEELGVESDILSLRGGTWVN